VESIKWAPRDLYLFERKQNFIRKREIIRRGKESGKARTRANKLSCAPERKGEGSGSAKRRNVGEKKERKSAPTFIRKRKGEKRTERPWSLRRGRK